MQKIGELFKSDDFKNEKHVPVIECTDQAAADEVFEIKVSVGKEIAHPNTTAHHIRWIQVYFLPEGEKAAYEVGNFQFTAHGESTKGADEGPVYTHHCVTLGVKLKNSGTIIATSYCNIHGLWESSKGIKVG